MKKIPILRTKSTQNKTNTTLKFQSNICCVPYVAIISPSHCNILEECLKCEESSIGSFLGDLELGTPTSSLSFLSYSLCHSLIRRKTPFKLLGLNCLENCDALFGV